MSRENSKNYVPRKKDIGIGSRKEFCLTKILTVLVTIPMLFSGGQLVSYIVNTNMYHLKDSLFLLIIPPCVSTMNIIILRTYIQTSIPASLMDSARIDGAGEYRAFFQITFPLMKPALASVGFMINVIKLGRACQRIPCIK